MKNATEVRKRIEEMSAENGGRVTPEELVADGENATSPLHEAFEWDDEIAGPQYRLLQARQMLRVLKVEVTITDHSYRVPMFIRNPSLPVTEQGYIRIATVRNNREMAKDAVQCELERVKQALRRAREVAVVLELDGMIDEYIESLASLSAQLGGVI